MEVSMPIYKYECNECNYQFEKLQALNDPYPECLKCRHTVRRLISLTSGKVKRDSKTKYYEEILPEAKEIADRIKNGDEEAAADIFGEDKMYE
jgi:putative FmdB family regulatory protein